MAYSHFDCRGFDYTQLDYRRLDYKDVWTIPIGFLVHLDYIRSDYVGLCNVFSY